MSAAQIDVDRLCKLLGMLGSHHVGERDSAGRMAHELVRKAGVTWPQLLNGHGKIAVILAENSALRAENERPRRCPPKPGPFTPDATTLMDRVEALLQHERLLNGWEVGFLESLLRYHTKGPTPRQVEILDDIQRKIERAIGSWSGKR